MISSKRQLKIYHWESENHDGNLVHTFVTNRIKFNLNELKDAAVMDRLRPLRLRLQFKGVTIQRPMHEFTLNEQGTLRHTNAFPYLKHMTDKVINILKREVKDLVQFLNSKYTTTCVKCMVAIQLCREIMAFLPLVD